MPHSIQTNLNPRAQSFSIEGAKVQAKMRQIAEAHAASGLITLDDSGSKAVVVINYHSGAALRDVVDALDRGGYLD